MRKKLYLIALLAVVALGLGRAVTVAAWHGQGGFGPGGHPPGPPDPDAMVAHMTKELSLTDDQATQIRAVLTDEMAKIAPYQSQLDDAAKQIHDATANGQFDEAKLRAIAATQAQAFTELTVE